jgi:hypothetical protein
VASIEGGVGKRRSCGIDRGAADWKFGKIELVMELMRSFAQNGDRRPSYFRADAVPREQNNGLLHGQTPIAQY